MAASLFFQIWIGIFSNILYYNVFDLKIIPFGSGLILVYVQHNKRHPADPPNEIAIIFVFQKYIK